MPIASRYLSLSESQEPSRAAQVRNMRQEVWTATDEEAMKPTISEADFEKLAIANGWPINRVRVERPVEPPDDMKDEKAFQAAVVKEAEKLCWLVYHPWSSVRSKAGYPDLTLVREGRVVFIELKTEKGVLSADQMTWRDALLRVGGNVDYYVFRPADWEHIMETLTA